MIKILHVASFSGNIGDNASHLGFYNILDELGLDYKITPLEIRRSYNNYNLPDKLVFDEKFVIFANEFDYVVFGGGGFLDYWVDGTCNGTTINIKEEVLDKIRSKVLITSIGSNPHREVPYDNYKKYRSFLAYVAENKNITIAFRNDGSTGSVQKDFGYEAVKDIPEILDHGFFYNIIKEFEFSIADKYVAINVTIDQLEMKGKLISDWYYSEFEIILNKLIDIGYKIVFVPHIHSDILAISSLLKRLPNQLVRNYTSVAPCVQGDLGTDLIFNIYKKSELIIASRYHANVCGLKFGVPTIGLSPLPRIEYVQGKLSKSPAYCDVVKGFSAEVINFMSDIKSHVIDQSKYKEMKNYSLNFYREYFNLNGNK